MSAAITNLEFAWPRESGPAARGAPAITVTEGDDFYAISTDLPGVAADDIMIGLVDGVLTIAATLDCEASDEIGPVFAINHQHGKIEQSFALPGDIDPESVSAVFDDTVLRVCIGRKFENLQ